MAVQSPYTLSQLTERTGIDLAALIAGDAPTSLGSIFARLGKPLPQPYECAFYPETSYTDTRVRFALAVRDNELDLSMRFESEVGMSAIYRPSVVRTNIARPEQNYWIEIAHDLGAETSIVTRKNASSIAEEQALRYAAHSGHGDLLRETAMKARQTPSDAEIADVAAWRAFNCSANHINSLVDAVCCKVKVVSYLSQAPIMPGIIVGRQIPPLILAAQLAADTSGIDNSLRLCA